MHLPPLNADGFLPLGRFGCTTGDLENEFVDDAKFAASRTREQIFTDFLETCALFDAFGVDLIETIWVGGSFVTGKVDPDDLDCLFILNATAFHDLPSNSKRSQVLTLGRKNYVRDKFGFRVEPFVMVRAVIAMPWEGAGVSEEASEYTAIRGAWDDWWLRTRTTEGPDEDPVLASAHPRRGYLEVRRGD